LTEKTKQCTKCKKVKPLSEFGNSKYTKDGKTYKCLQCKREYAKNYLIKNKHNPEIIYKKLRFNAKNFGKKFTLTLDEFEQWYTKQEFKCGYCNLPEEDLKHVDDTFMKMSKNRLTVDCIDNDIGYADGNLILACIRCNNLKSDILNFEQMRYIGQSFLKPIWEKQLNKKL